MRQLSTTVTRKGQITVPAELRKKMGLKRGDKVAFIIEDGIVRFDRAMSVVEMTKGIFKSDEPALSPRELREAFEQGVADEVVEKMNRSRG